MNTYMSFVLVFGSPFNLESHVLSHCFNNFPSWFLFLELLLFKYWISLLVLYTISHLPSLWSPMLLFKGSLNLFLQHPIELFIFVIIFLVLKCSF